MTPITQPIARPVWSGSKPLSLVGRKHSALHRPVEPVEADDPRFILLAHRMLATLDRMSGVALAAPQVGHAVNLVVFKHGAALINLTVTGEGTRVRGLEGCLSLPGRWYEVPRHPKATVRAQLLNGDPCDLRVSGFEARMMQHEADHLAGLLLVGRFDEVRHPEKWSA